ncbi:hypothetical protein GQ43DRAFT_381455 [Delitschia confertaspora ATCC 74209]|uniref:DUF6594 domain-containing protein n=1 Tax=Delitschia confertaspora ATCC 74209 TaxID=1513339 RepID=A0A9P4MUP6_9PLEO|nr:hypothetical protein GQ43DRAFT_381455 [Delitschia confertaspora ATCC 74209]
MTGETFVSEKTVFGPQFPASPTSPTNTVDSGATLNGDAIIPIQDEVHSSSQSSSVVSSMNIEPPTLPQRPTKLLQRITGSFKRQPEPLDITETRTRALENTPNGFPRLAAFQSSEANFSLYRSFSYLHSRLLLDLQDELTTLEKELDDMDEDDSYENPQRLRSREIDVQKAEAEGDGRNRRVILKEIREKLMEYDEVLIKARTLESFQKPSDRNYRSVRRYHHNTKPLMDSEMDSIRTKEDTISLRSGREWATFDGGIETLIAQLDKTLQWIFHTQNPPLQRLFRTPELRAKTTNKFINFYSSSRIDTLVGVLITIIIFILLVIPVVTMYYLTSTTSHPNRTMSESQTLNAVGVLIVFTLLFSAAMSLLTKAQRHELFAASAAYCAILVVFIGNFTGPGN